MGMDFEADDGLGYFAALEDDVGSGDDAMMSPRVGQMLQDDSDSD